jgi:hypothetical protein
MDYGSQVMRGQTKDFASDKILASQLLLTKDLQDGILWHGSFLFQEEYLTQVSTQTRVFC